MELDVHLTRDGEESWGFELIGGADFEIPLTIDKVVPSSPAQRSGLLPGDIIARIGDRLATELSLETAQGIVADAIGSLSFGICRGLYEPVLDDYEPIYEPSERADSDLRSEPTEVHDLSLDDPNILDPNITDPSLWDSGYGLSRPVTETRSLTASPFVPNNKPYRPFSTDPLEVPPLDDPIILNPNYKDSFKCNNQELPDPKDDDLLRILPLDRNIEPKFKLPISEKYDPNWDKKVKAMLEKCVEGGRKEIQEVEKELIDYSKKAEMVTIELKDLRSVKEMIVQENETKSSKVTKECEEMRSELSVAKSSHESKEAKFDKINNEESKSQKIEQIALDIVEQSIERAVSVTKEIKQEIEEELRASMTRELKDESKTNSETKNHVEEVKSKVATKESVIHNENIEQSYETLNEQNILIQDNLKQDEKFTAARKLTIKKGIEENIEAGNVSRKSSAFEKRDERRTECHEDDKHVIEESISAGTVKRESMAKVESRKVSQAKEIQSEHQSKEFESSGIFNETLQSESKQKAYMIGLQTIPHIKGFVQSSYHFDLLLRTFFVHLTDVMVALSRFILTQPTQELETKAEKVVKEKLIKEFVEKDMRRERRETGQSQENKKEIRQVVTEKSRQEEDTKQKQEERKEMQQQFKETQKNQMDQRDQTKTEEIKQQEISNLDINLENVEMRKKTGAEMAQRTQRKSKDLTQKMDAVITEFEMKTGTEEKLEVSEQRKRRSRSRSQIEEEVMTETDPLEWLDKVDSRRSSQERTFTKTEKGAQSYSESRESKRSETKLETQTTKIKPGKQMYVAIVESHVFTNKDAILEDQVAEMSETASVQSSEETNAAQESFGATSTENAVMTNFISEEKQQAVEIITHALEEVVQEKQEVLEAVQDIKSEIKEEHSKSITQESHYTIAAESTETISESKVEAFKTADIIQEIASEVQQEKYQTAAMEFEDIALEATKEVIETKIQTKETISNREILESIAAETIEVVDEAKIETFETKEATTTTAVEVSEENYKATAQSTTEMVLEASKEEMIEFEVKEEQAVSKVESLAIAVAESTDVVVDDSKLETFESQELISEKAKVASEETFKTAAVEITDVTFETAEEKHSEMVQTCEVKLKEEAQNLVVAGIIETKTELCKELKKPAEDESASLKIVKYEIIDGGESTEVLSESELNVKQSVDVEMSSQHAKSTSELNYQSVSQETISLEQSAILIETSSLLVNESTSIQNSLSTVQKSSSSSVDTATTLQESSSSQDRSRKTLHIDTNLSQYQISNGDENNNTPTPTTQPPTPLTDEYVFKLEIPLPKNSGTVIIEESPDREDPHIVKKGLVPYIETTIEDQIIYDPPLPTPPEDKVTSPVYTKPGLRGGAQPMIRREYIREIERKSSLLASAIDETIKSIEEYKEEVGIETTNFTIPLPKRRESKNTEVSNGTNTSDDVIDVTVPLPKSKVSKDTNAVSNGHVENGVQNGVDSSTDDVPPGFKPVVFNPEAYQAKLYEEVTRGPEPLPSEVKPYVDASGELLGTVQGIVDGLEDAVVDEEVAKELGKPGLTEDTIAVLISGESEMLREAHVMGVDFQKIKPLVPSLKDSEVIKALNEELKRECADKKKKEAVESKKWTTFLQKPTRPVPRSKHGYPGYVEPESVEVEEPYKVKIVKQPKPKVAPDYKPEDFDTGPLPWEQRALEEPVPSPVPPEEPILVPDQAEFFEAVDPLPESEVPDLEDTGIPLPPTPPPPADLPHQKPEPEVEACIDPETEVPAQEAAEEEVKPASENMDQNRMAEQLVNTVKGMVDPNAPLEQQLSQMRAQLAALAQLPCVIQQSLEVLTRQLSNMTHMESRHTSHETQMSVESRQEIHESTMPAIQEYQEQDTQNGQEITQNSQEFTQNGQEFTQEQKEEDNSVTIVEVQEETVSEEALALKREHEAMIEEQMKSEKEKKERQEKARLEQEARQLKQRAPRVGKPRPVFGPLTPEERPLVLPGGRRWRGPKDAYNDQFIAETLTSQSEIIQGKVLGYESDRLPYDKRINFMKYEKPPVNLDHLENSPTYKLIHNMEDAPLKRTDMLTPVIAETDYRERCRSATPNMQAKALM